MAYLFCNIGWMKYYRGRPDDDISGNSKHVREEGWGYEACNFAEHEGIVYGFVQRRWKSDFESVIDIKLERIVNGRAQSIDGKIENVLVIWTAPRPDVGSVVVGWYRNATVFREYQEFDPVPPLHKKNGLDGYRILTKSGNEELLPTHERNILVPRGRGGMGQDNVWYGEYPPGRELASKVAALAGVKI